MSWSRPWADHKTPGETKYFVSLMRQVENRGIAANFRMIPLDHVYSLFRASLAACTVRAATGSVAAVLADKQIRPYKMLRRYSGGSPFLQGNRVKEIRLR
jgi:hypothetical protein